MCCEKKYTKFPGYKAMFLSNKGVTTGQGKEVDETSTNFPRNYNASENSIGIQLQKWMFLSSVDVSFFIIIYYI